MIRLILIAATFGLALAFAGCSGSSEAPPFPSRTTADSTGSVKTSHTATPEATDLTPTDTPSTHTPAPSVTPVTVGGDLPPDPLGSKDFAGVPRYPNSYIGNWKADAFTTVDCTNDGPIPGYERWEIQYRPPEGTTLQPYDILSYIVPRLQDSGWLVHRSDAYSVLLYRGAKPQFNEREGDCNSDGETDWISIVIFDKGVYNIQLTLPKGSDPYMAS